MLAVPPAAAPYRASGLVPWHTATDRVLTADRRFRGEADAHERRVLTISVENDPHPTLKLKRKREPVGRERKSTPRARHAVITEVGQLSPAAEFV